MKNYLMLFSAILVSVILVSSSALAEVYLWQDISVNRNLGVVSQSAYIQYEDTSITGVGRSKDIPISLLYVVEPLPYNLSAVNYTYGGINISANYSGEVDYCNLSIIETHNIYSTNLIAFEGFVGGNLINTTRTETSYYFASTGMVSTATLNFDMRDRDSLVVSMKCHYTAVNSTYVENVLFGRFDVFTPAFECSGCEEYTIEEQSNEIERTDEILSQETQIYRRIQQMIGFNYKLWLIISWLVKIALIFVAIGSIFQAVTYVYKMFVRIEKVI